MAAGGVGCQSTWHEGKLPVSRHKKYEDSNMGAN